MESTWSLATEAYHQGRRTRHMYKANVKKPLINTVNRAINKVCKRRREETINCAAGSLYRFHCKYRMELTLEEGVEFIWNKPAFMDYF